MVMGQIGTLTKGRPLSRRRSPLERAIDVAVRRALATGHKQQVRVCGPFRPEDHDLHTPKPALVVQEIR